MARWVYLSVVVVALAAGAVLVQAQLRPTASWDIPAGSKNTGPRPKAVIEGPLTHDFGAMSTQKTGTHSWKVKNEGGADLELWMVSSTCMCTIAKFKGEKKAVVKPGESTEIELEWKTNNAVGDYSKGATIGTNDPDRPEFKMGVRGRVHNPIVMLPEPTEGVFPIGVISNDKTEKTSMALFSPDTPEMKIVKISTSKPDLIEVKPIPLTPEDCKQLKTKAGFRLDVSIKPGMSLGNFRDQIIVETDHPMQSKVEMTLVGVVSGPISVLPSNLRILSVNSSQDAVGQVTLLVRNQQPTKFKVLHKPEKAEVDIEPNETPTLKARYRMTVRVPSGTSPGIVEDQIILQTDHPAAKEVKIPVNIVIGTS